MGQEPNSTAPLISIESNVTDFVAAVDDQKLYIRSLVSMKIKLISTFYHKMVFYIIKSNFKVPQVHGDAWVSFDDKLCITPGPMSTQRAFEITPEAPDNAVKKIDD